jgi:fucose permease
MLAVGAFLFVPAASFASFPLFLGGGRVMGTIVAWDLVETFLAAEFSRPNAN